MRAPPRIGGRDASEAWTQQAQGPETNGATNNNAEHAVKAFVSLRRVIDGSTTEQGLRDYLILLSLCETCKYRDLDFLHFLRSGSKDIDDFDISRRKQGVRTGI